MESNSIIEKVKELVRKGNVSRIIVRKGDKVLVDVPVNVGIVGGVVALASSKILLLAGVLATVGFGCTVEVIKNDGQVVDVLNEESAQKARDVAAGVVEDVKDALNLDKKETSGFEETVAADEPDQDDTTEE